MATVPKSSRVLETTLATASAGPFSLGFRVFDTDGFEVYVDGVAQTVTTDYSISASFSDGYDDSATITFTSTLDAGTVVVVYGAMVADRDADYADGDANLTLKMNTELARLAAMQSEAQRDIGRTLRVVSSDGLDPVAPVASRLLGWDASGNLTHYTLTPTTTVGDAVEFDSFAAFLADTSTYTAGTQVKVPSIGAVYSAVASSGNLGQANAGGREWDVTSKSGVFDVEYFGGAADNSTDNAPLANRALAAIAALGGGVLRFSQPGTYLIEDTGALDYDAGNNCAIVVTGSNTTIVIEPGATVKLADDQQTGTTPWVNLIGVPQQLSNVHVVVNGILDGNISGQSGWTAGYTQKSSGNGVLFFYDNTDSDPPAGNVSVTGTGTIQHCGSSPVWAPNAGEDEKFTTVRLADFRYLDCGEGPEVSNARNVQIDGIRLETSGDMTMAGDGLEIAGCIDFSVTNTFQNYVHRLLYDAETAAFTPGDTLTGGTSGATADIVSVTDDGTTGTLYLKSVVGVFADDETITDGAGGSATVNGTLVQSCAGTAVELYNSRQGVVDGGYWNGGNQFVGTTDAGSAPGVDDVTVKNITAIAFVNTNPWGINGRGSVVWENIEIVGFRSMFKIENSLTSDVNFINVRGENSGNPIVRTERTFRWYGGGNVNSPDYGMWFNAAEDDLVIDVDFNGLDFTGATDESFLFNPGSNTGFQVTGTISNTRLDAGGVSISANSTVSGLSWIKSSPRTVDGLNGFTIYDIHPHERVERNGTTQLRSIEATWEGHRIELVAGAAFDVKHNNVSAVEEPIFLVSGANIAMAEGDIIELEYLVDNVTTSGWYQIGAGNVAVSDGTTGGAVSAGAGNQYVAITIGGTTYKVLHDGTV